MNEYRWFLFFSFPSLVNLEEVNEDGVVQVVATCSRDDDRADDDVGSSGEDDAVDISSPELCSKHCSRQRFASLASVAAFASSVPVSR